MNAPATAALDRILAPVGRCLTPEAARALIRLRADDDMQARLEDLADKSTAGALTPAEREEYEAYVSALDFVAVLQAKARAMLANDSAA